MNVKIRRDECDDEKVDESNEWRMRRDEWDVEMNGG
jgi:hypothetical protein